MENASKALLMAGGVLIAIIMIGLVVKVFGSINLFQKSRLTEEEQAQLVAFNEQYTRYLGQYVYGTEVITVINKSLDNRSHTIKTTVVFNAGYQYKVKEWNRDEKKYKEKEIIVGPGEAMSITNEDDDVAYNIIDEDTGSYDSLRSRAFKCTNITYDSYGRVNSIKFEEKKWGDT